MKENEVFTAKIGDISPLSAQINEVFEAYDERACADLKADRSDIRASVEDHD